MNKWFSVLLALIVLQIIATVFVWWPRPQGFATGKPLFHFKPATVTGITLAQPQNGKLQKLTLTRDGAAHAADAWQLPDDYDFPADKSQVQELLTDVAGLKTSLPVALTADAATRFEVAKANYATLVTFDTGGDKIKLYVGNSAGANLVYIRKPGERDIYSVELPASLLTTATDSWQDEDLLEVPMNKITRVQLPDFTLIQKNSNWHLAKAKTALNQNKVSTLISQLADASFLTVAGRRDKFQLPGSGFDADVTADGKTLSYHFAEKPAKKSKGKDASPTWYLTRSDLPYVFTVDSYLATSMQKASMDSLEATPAKN